MRLCAVVLLAAALSLCGCANRLGPSPSAAGSKDFIEQLRTLRSRFAPDPHLAIFTVGVQTNRGTLVLTGEVDRAEARVEALRIAAALNLPVEDHIRVLPDPGLGATNWGITTLSVANGREATGHTAELGTQTLMGESVRILKRQGRWLFVQSADGYLSWMESGSLKLGSRAEVDTWEQSPQLIVTNFEATIHEMPTPNSPPVSDVVLGGRVRKLSEAGDWHHVELPDGRTGFLPIADATDHATWQRSRRPTPEQIELTARQFIGRPYLWGAGTPRGMDCSGFTKLVFFLNGVELRRNASQQAEEGVAVPLDRSFSQLRKGDLLFFGFEGDENRRSRISHVGIYLGDRLFMQSSQRVRVSSLDPASPLADPGRIRGLVKARRVLPAD